MDRETGGLASLQPRFTTTDYEQTALTIDALMRISEDLWRDVPEHQTVITINDRTRSILIRGMRRRNERKRFVRRTILSRMTKRQALRAMIAR